MSDRFFNQPILNSPYEYPTRHWELDDEGQPTQQIIEYRRVAKFITPIPKPRKQKQLQKQMAMVDTYWIPGVNNLGAYGRWAFVELTDVFDMEAEFAARIEAEVTAQAGVEMT